MENKQILENMSRLGYPLLDSLTDLDVYETLAQVVKSGNGRFWEGFPVLLANAAKENNFDYAKVESWLNEAGEKARLKDLFLLSLALYQLNKLGFKWTKKLFAQLTESEKQKVQDYREALNKNSALKVSGDDLDPGRFKNAFKSYFTLEAVEAREQGDRHGELSLGFALSQVFPPKQRELFNKKLKGEMLTKTEREYFSRVVRKKASALANDELHQLARKVMEM